MVAEMQQRRADHQVVTRPSPTLLPMILAAALLSGPSTLSRPRRSSTKMCRSLLGGNLFSKL
jgi:hypothetical protein